MYFVIKNEDGSIFRCGPIEGPIPGAWVRGARTLEVAPDDDPQVTAWREQLEREASLADEQALRLAEEQARLTEEQEQARQARQAEREALRAGLEGASTTAKLREAMLALLARLEALEGR